MQQARCCRVCRYRIPPVNPLVHPSPGLQSLRHTQSNWLQFPLPVWKQGVSPCFSWIDRISSCFAFQPIRRSILLVFSLLCAGFIACLAVRIVAVDDVAADSGLLARPCWGRPLDRRGEEHEMPRMRSEGQVARGNSRVIPAHSGVVHAAVSGKRTKNTESDNGARSDVLMIREIS